jgi:hypothetical protein
MGNIREQTKSIADNVSKSKPRLMVAVLIKSLHSFVEILAVIKSDIINNNNSGVSKGIL